MRYWESAAERPAVYYQLVPGSRDIHISTVDYDFLHLGLQAGATWGIGKAAAMVTVRSVTACGPWGVLIGGAAGFAGGAIVGAAVDWLEGERDPSRIGAMALQTGVEVGLGMLLGPAVAAFHSGLGPTEAGQAFLRGEAGPALQKAIDVLRPGAIVGATAGYLAGTIIAPLFGFGALPTKDIGGQPIARKVFGRPDDPTTPAFALDPLPKFPDGMATITCPWMKSTSPAYPTLYYLADQTEYLHVVGVPDFLTHCFESLGDDGEPLTPQSANVMPRGIGEPDGTALFLERYRDGSATLTRTMQKWVHADDTFHDSVGRFASDQFRQQCKDAVNKICATISQHAPVMPLYAPVTGVKNLHALAYLNEAIATGTAAFGEAISTAQQLGGQIANTKTAGPSNVAGNQPPGGSAETRIIINKC